MVLKSKHSRRRRDIRTALLLGAAAGLLPVFMVLAGCGDDDSDSPTAPDSPTEQTTPVKVSNNSTFVAEFDSQDAAAAKASELVGFEVLPVEGLPSGFTVDAFNVLANAGPASRGQALISSERGGLLIEQMNTGATPPQGSTRLSSTGPGDYFSIDNSDRPQFELVLPARTFTILAPSAAALTDDEAIAILERFARRV